MDLFITGNVQTILQGHVTPKVLHSVFPNDLQYALGGAALPDCPTLEIGETIIHAGVGHIFTSKGQWSGKSALQAAFLMGIKRQPKERLEVTKSQSIAELYADLAKRYEKGFVITGKARFSKLHAAFLQLSPIYGENINVLHDKYWHTQTSQDLEADLFGVVMSKPDPRAFYQNPNETKAEAVASHTHVLTSSARHLLTDSELASGTFWIETIDIVR